MLTSSVEAGVALAPTLKNRMNDGSQAGSDRARRPVFPALRLTAYGRPAQRCPLEPLA